MNTLAKFNIGDLVVHTQQHYRAVIIDVDPLFQASGYNPGASKREFATRNPWYRLLVDDSSQITYVEECLLRRDSKQYVINNPHVVNYLVSREGIYYRNTQYN